MGLGPGGEVPQRCGDHNDGATALAHLRGSTVGRRPALSAGHPPRALGRSGICCRDLWVGSATVGQSGSRKALHVPDCRARRPGHLWAVPLVTSPGVRRVAPARLWLGGPVRRHVPPSVVGSGRCRCRGVRSSLHPNSRRGDAAAKPLWRRDLASTHCRTVATGALRVVTPPAGLRVEPFRTRLYPQLGDALFIKEVQLHLLCARESRNRGG
mmetsp:Transcript_20383/g.52955  ORF Transcript_20383/g.52955 Transcript_20383/m.52955 type:complete len:212 (+) Transcript_20383:222-857(+)